jgi:uncharacterized protein YraI
MFEVLDGPRCADDIMWWQVSYNGVEGWTGEAMGQSYWVEPIVGQTLSVSNATPTLSMSPTPASCGGIASRLWVGGQARVLPGDPNNLRDEPSSSGRRTGEIPGGEVFNVLEGPRCVDEVLWWRVSYNNQFGWTVEASDEDYWVEPVGERPAPTPTALPAIICPGFSASRLVVGQQGRVTPGDPNNMRSETNTTSQWMGEIPAGGVFDVLEGPVCAGGTAWWRVQYNGITAWTLEGLGTTYALEPVAPVVESISVAAPTIPTSCVGLLMPRLVAGERGRVLPGDPNVIREGPSRETERLGEIPEGGTFNVYEGPVCENNIVWWRVSYEDLSGWTPEGSGQDYWLEPILRVQPTPDPSVPEECRGRTLILQRGGQGIVRDNTTINVRSEPTSDAELVGTVAAGSMFAVQDGPRCADDMVWWQVNAGGLVGWAGESRNGERWVDPYVVCDGVAPARVGIGGYGYIEGVEGNKLRSGPSTSTDMVGGLPPGQFFQVIDGPRCGEGMRWWRVSEIGGNNESGWTVEAQGETYWFEAAPWYDPSNPPQ